jgi:O-antigen ligase
VAASGVSSDFASPLERLSTSTASTGTQNATFWTRVDAYEAAWREIRAHPLYGVGLESSDTPTDTGSQVHNIILKPLFEGGILAALGIAIVYLVVAVAAWQVVVRARTEAEYLLSFALLGAYVAFVTWGMATPALFKRYGWMSGALILALHVQQVRSRRRGEDEPQRLGYAAGIR